MILRGLGNLTHAYDTDGPRAATCGSLTAVTLPAALSRRDLANADDEQSKFNGTSLSYDANGNLTGDGTNTYTWDARNHLTQITQRRTTVGSFVYDAFGQRMNKTVSGTTTQFLYDRLNPVQELNSSNGVVANLLTGLSIDEYFTRTDTATSTFLADALGSTVGLVGSGGTITTSYNYQPFGGTTAGGSANGNSYQFTGRENDGTGLYFYRARYYSPTFQRFIAQDPTDFLGGINLYGYVSNNPQSLRDPLGLWVAGVGLNGGVGGLGAGGSWTKELVFDGEGNIGIATTICAGGMTTVASGGGGGAVSFNGSLSTISELAGPSLEVGAEFPVGEGWGGGPSLTTQKNKCGKPTFGGNFFFGGAGGWPPIPITLGGVACNTTVQPISWTITGPTGGDVPSFVPVP